MLQILCKDLTNHGMFIAVYSQVLIYVSWTLFLVKTHSKLRLYLAMDSVTGVVGLASRRHHPHNFVFLCDAQHYVNAK